MTFDNTFSIEGKQWVTHRRKTAKHIPGEPFQHTSSFILMKRLNLMFIMFFFRSFKVTRKSRILLKRLFTLFMFLLLSLLLLSLSLSLLLSLLLLLSLSLPKSLSVAGVRGDTVSSCSLVRLWRGAWGRRVHLGEVSKGGASYVVSLLLSSYLLTPSPSL